MNERIKSKDFSKLINQSSTIGNYTIEGELEFLERGFTNEIVIKNCKFQEIFIFKSCRFFKSLTFENCEFQKGLCFSEIEVIGNLLFKSCHINYETILKDCTLSSFLSDGTHFEKALFCGYLKNNAIRNEEIVFINSFFKKLSFNDIECNKPLRLKDLSTISMEIYRSIINADISFGNFENTQYFIAEDVNFESSKFKQRLDFHNGNVKQYIYIHKIIFEEQVVFNRDFDFKTLMLTEIRARYTFGLDFQDNFENISLTDCHFETSFAIYTFKKLLNYEKKVSIDFNGVINGNYIIEEVPTISIHLSGINYANIIFQNVGTKFITFSQFYNFSRNSKVFINSIKCNSDYNTLIIFDSNLGNTEFENIDFRKFDEIIIAKSEVSNMLLTNSIFPKKIQIKSKSPQLGYEIPISEKINDNMYFRDSYRQLKLAMEKMGNRYYSLVYKSQEMYYHRKELKWGWDKILLSINFLSNNNGISWTRGIFFTLTCSLITFLCLNTQLNQPLFFWTSNTTLKDTFDTFKLATENYISYLSTYPILRIDNLKENWIVDLIILLSRIFISVGIYQIITAFRKYGKGS